VAAFGKRVSVFGERLLNFNRLTFVLAAFVIAANVSTPASVAIADDYVVDASGAAATEIGENGQAGTKSPGDQCLPCNGGNGTEGGSGPTGNDGDDRTVTILAPVDGDVRVSSNGGQGGTGGRGGDGQDGGSAVMITQWGMNGGNGGKGGKGGTGGNGGSIDLAIDAAVGGDIVVSAAGGQGGDGGRGGNGGNGGNGHAAYTFNGGYYDGAGGGSGGNGHVGGMGGDGGACAFAPCVSGPGGLGGDGVAQAGSGGTSGGTVSGATEGVAYGPGSILAVDTFTGAKGADGNAGSVAATVNAAVGGKVDLTARQVALLVNQGGEIGGPISAIGAETASLTFHLDVSNPDDYATASNLLGDQANAASGTITVDGRTYTWSGFTELINQLTLLEVTEVTIHLSSSGPSTLDAPLYLRCKPRAVTAFVKDDVITITAKRLDDVAGSFGVGTLASGRFKSSNPLGWTAKMSAEKKHVTVLVLDGAGDTVATCRR
jgi:hypothetical protein